MVLTFVFLFLCFLFAFIYLNWNNKIIKSLRIGAPLGLSRNFRKSFQHGMMDLTPFDSFEDFL